MGVRTRMTPQQRRAQLLDLGAELFAEQHYDDVHIERVAELAGVSRGLLYHYFPTKRAFFAELVERATEQMLADTAPDPQLPILEQLRNGIDAYLTSCRANRHGSQAVHSGAASSDPAVIALIEQSARAQEDRILAVIDPGRTHPDLLRIAVHSWLMMLRTACQAWLASENVSAHDVRQMAEHALLGALAGLPDHARAGAMAQLLDIEDA